jgi:heptose I phosphotransferase
MTDTLWHRLTRGGRRLRQRPDWADLIGPDWADWIMGIAVTDRYHAKQGRSTGRWVIQAGERRLAVYLKRHYDLPWWRGFLAAVWPGADWSPALQEWRNLAWARAQGVPVPDSVAAGEYLGPWGRFQSFLAVEELTGMLPLHEAIPLAAAELAPEDFRHWKKGLTIELARLTRDLHLRRHYHKDLYLCHFYIPGELIGTVPVWQGQVRMIDFHRLRHHPWVWWPWQVKDLAQLLYSSEITGVAVRDRLRFWRAYLGNGRRGMRTRLLRRLILLKWQRYRRHNAKRG